MDDTDVANNHKNSLSNVVLKQLQVINNLSDINSFMISAGKHKEMRKLN